MSISKSAKLPLYRTTAVYTHHHTHLKTDGPTPPPEQQQLNIITPVTSWFHKNTKNITTRKVIIQFDNIRNYLRKIRKQSENINYYYLSQIS